MAVVLTQSFSRAPFSQTSKHPRRPPAPLPVVRLPAGPRRGPPAPGLRWQLEVPSRAGVAGHVAAHVARPQGGVASLEPPPVAGAAEVEVAGVLLPRHPGPVDPAKVPTAEQARLLVTKSMERSMRFLAKTWVAGVPTKLEGATGVGKTAVIRALAHATQSEYVRVNLSYFTEVEDLLGRHVGGTHEHTEEKLQARTDAQLRRIAAGLELPAQGDRPAVIARILREQGKIRWVDGPVIKAMQRGAVLLLDEINLARPDVIEALNGLFDRGQLITQNGVQSVAAHPSFRLFATQNPSSYAGRQDMSAALSSRWASLTWDPLPADEIFQVLQSRYGSALPQTLFAKLCMAHSQLASLAEAGEVGADRGGVAYTLRDLFKVADRFLRYRAKNPASVSDAYLVAREAYEVYVGGLEDPGDRQRLRGALKPFLPAIGDDFYRGLSLERTATGWRMGDVELDDRLTGHVFVPSTDLVMTPATLEVYARLFKALDMRENVALIGERASGKSAMGEAYAAHAGLPLYPEHFDAGMDGSRLIGTDTPLGWQDGLLLAAAREGGVLLADEFNLAPPEILERLNSLLDDERMLVLAEKEGERVDLHPDFRFIATMNPPRYAGRHKLSRAMLNRLTCIAVPTLESRADLLPIVEHKLAQGPQPAGVNAALAGALVGLHTWIRDAYRVGDLGKDLRRKDIPDYSLRQVLYATRLVTRFAGKDGVAEALRDALTMGYAQAGSADDKAIVEREIGQAVERVQRALGPDAEAVAPPPAEPEDEAPSSGERTLIRENGVYRGDTRDGLAHGHGHEEFLDGTVYEGQFEAGLRHGRGILRAVDRIYTGEFREGHLHGQGILRYASGDRYEGQFEEDQFHGQGTFFYQDGTRVDGAFKHGALVEGQTYDPPGSEPGAPAGPAPAHRPAEPSPEAKPAGTERRPAPTRTPAASVARAKPAGTKGAISGPAQVRTPGEVALPPAIEPAGAQRPSRQAMEAALRKWVESSPRRQREGYALAADHMLEAYAQRAPKLNLEFTELDSLPDELRHFAGHLEHLRLRGCHFKALPRVVTALTNLRILEAPQSGIEFLPDDIGKLTHLTTLDLHGNRLQSLPEALGGCVRLQRLQLDANKLGALPIRAGELRLLRTLSLANNRLRALPMTSRNWRDLTELDLAHNFLEALPPEASEWVQLERLDLDDNQLQAVPVELKKLQRLSALRLRNNPPMGALPEWLGNLPSLRHVWADHVPGELAGRLERRRHKAG